jgi:PAS domain S-box-containing protein
MKDWSRVLRGVGTRPSNTPAANAKTRGTILGDVNALLREAIDAVPAALYMTDADGYLSFYNEAAATLWGCRPELGESKFCGSWKLYWPDGAPLPHDECPMALALRQRRPIRGMEAVAERPDGTRIPFIADPTPLFDESGRLIGAVSTLVDICERKRVEAALAERQAQLAVFVEHAPAAIAMFDREMRYLAVSRRYIVDFRLPQGAQLIGRSHYEVFPDIPQRWRDVHARVLAGEELSQAEDQFTRQDGCTHWVRWSMAPWRRADGSIGGALLFSELRTEQVEARRALIDSEARFRGTFENAAVGVAMVGPDGSILRANNSFARMLGYSVEELKTKTFRDLTHPEDLATNLSVLNQTLVGEADSYSIEKRYVRKDGGVVWASLTVGCVRNADGGVDYFVSVVQDITARKHAEARLAERNEQLDLAGKIARIGTFTYDHATQKLQLSPGCAVIYGLLPESTLEISREHWRALVHPDDLPRLDAIAEHAFSNGETEFVLEFRIFRDGKVRWIESRVLVSFNELGQPVRRIGANIDVTERKRAEQGLAERNIQLALAAKSGLVGTYAYDADTEIMQISDGYAAIHGFPEGTTEIARSECLAGVHPDDIGRVEQFRSEAFRECRREYSVEYRIIRPGGELRWVETRCFLSFSGAGKPHRVVGVSIDITERKRVEEQQRTLLAELDHRVKNTLSTVSAVVSHTWQGSRSVADFVAALDGRIRSMTTTHELLSSGRWEGVSLAELVRRELAPYATANNTEINGPGVLLKPEAAQAMAMVLHELATNAAKYGALSTKNGRVSIRWDRHLNGHPRSHLAFAWQELGGPPVVALGKSSYGTSTIRDLIPYEFGGTVDLVRAPSGVQCRLELPAEWLGNDHQPYAETSPRTGEAELGRAPEQNDQ